MSRRASDDLAFAAGLLLGLVVMSAFGFFALRERVVGVNDFSYVWTGARTVVDGGDPYRPSSYLAVAARSGTAHPNERVFGYPPWVAIALVPLAALPVPVASGLWTFGGMALAALALRALLRAYVPGLPVAHTLAGLSLFASQPGTATMWSGQWGFVLVAALCGAVLGLRSRGPLAHLSLVALLAKPQLALFDLWAFVRAGLARRGPRFAASLVAACVAVVGVASAVYPDWVEAWRTDLIAARLGFMPPTTLATGLGDLVGPLGAWLAAGALVAAIALGLRLDPRGDAFLAVWVAASATFPPYGWSYDQLTLVVPLAIASGLVARRSRRAGLAFAVAGFAFFLFAPPLLYVVAERRQNESFNAFVPLAVLALVLVAAWRDRRAAPVDSIA